MNMICSNDLHEERRQALADDVIAEEMEALINNYGDLLRGALLGKANDLSDGQRAEAVKQIYAYFGRLSGLDEACVNITHDIRCKADDLGVRTMQTRKPRLLAAAE